MSVRPLGDWLADILVFFTILFFLGVGLVIATLLFAYVRGTLRERAVKRDKALTEKAKYRSDGRAFPSSGRGLCDGCEKVSEKVYYLPSGQRLCPGCYDEFDPLETG